MANYTVTNEFQSLSTIMGDDYDATKKYRIHNNIQVGHLVYSETGTDKGASVEFTDEIYNDAGIDLYLKMTGLDYDPFSEQNNVYITEVTE